MAEAKITAARIVIHAPNGKEVGYFLDAEIEAFPQGDYQITGKFYGDKDELASRLTFNPEAVPYSADLSSASNATHKKLKNVYVQRARQPIVMSGSGD
jgi:hypothetical protein